MALLDRHEIGETMTIRGEVRRRTSVKPDAGIGDGLSDTSSSSKTNSDNNFNDNEKEQEQIGAGDETKTELNGNGEKKIDQEGVKRGSVVHYAYRPCTSAHRRIKESPLSSDAIFKQSHAGLFNLCIVVLVAVNSRLIIENLMKYGLLINSNFWFSSRSLRDWPLLMCWL